MIIRLCEEHQPLAGVLPIDEIRKMWTWADCGCRIILDND